MVHYLSKEEIHSVTKAIAIASKNDSPSMDRIADFIFSLVHFTNMKPEALISAVYHFVSSDLGSMSSAKLKSGPNTFVNELSTLQALAGTGLEKYPPETIKISLAACRLQRFELLASNVVTSGSSSSSSSKITPKNSQHLHTLLLSTTSDWRALAIRSVAALHTLTGMEASLKPRNKNLVQAAMEALYVWSPISERLGMYLLKNELQEAAFRVLYPLQHKLVSEKYLEVAKSVDAVLEETTVLLKRALLENDEFLGQISKVSISGRRKELYPAWRKLLKGGERGEMRFTDIDDAAALRVVVELKEGGGEEVDLCRFVAKICGETFPAYKKRKDYIETPKINGYKSIHLRNKMSWHGESVPFEIQIRSAEMHKVAEYGFASHWSYKLKNEEDRSPSDGFITNVVKFEEKEKVKEKGKEKEKEKEKISLEEIEEATLQLEMCQLNELSILRLVGGEGKKGKKKEQKEKEKEEEGEGDPYIKAFEDAQQLMVREKVTFFITSNTGETKIVCLPRGSRLIDAISHEGKEGGVVEEILNNNVTINGVVRNNNLLEVINVGDVICMRES